MGSYCEKESNAGVMRVTNFNDFFRQDFFSQTTMHISASTLVGSFAMFKKDLSLKQGTLVRRSPSQHK